MPKAFFDMDGVLFEQRSSVGKCVDVNEQGGGFEANKADD